MGAKIRSNVISVTFLLGSLFWLLDGTLDYFFFYEGPFIGIVFSNVPPHELYIRLFWFTGLLIVGAFSSRIIKARDVALKDKQELEELLRSVRNINQLLVKEDERDTLIQGACDDLYETRGFHHVWIALLDEDNRLISGAESGLGEKFEPMLEVLETGPPPKKVKQVLEKPEIVTTRKATESCEDCPLDEECKKGTTITRSLEYNDRVYGLISACVPEHFVKGEGLSLFEEVAGDIALGLHDIEVEEELHRSKERYQKYFDKTGDAIFILKMGGEAHGKILEVNPTAVEQTGYSREELIGMNMLEDLTLKSPPDFDLEKVDLKLSRGETVRFIEKKEKKNGEEYWTDVVVTPLEQEGKQANLSINRDITERKKAEQALERSEKRYRTVFENTGTAMIIIEEDTTISLANEEVEELSGYSKDEIEGRMSWTDLVAKDEDLERMKEYHRTRRSDPDAAPNQYEFTLADKEGNEKEVMISIEVLPGTKKSVASLMDITEQKKAQAKLRQSFIELAETTSRVLGVRDPYTQRHEQRVAELAKKVGRRMGLSEEKLLGLYIGGALHDIGKIVVPETILTKPGELKEVEWEMIKSHPEVGYNQILEDTDFPWPVAEMTLHHHERLDGSGYPDGLEGDELTTEVRILGAVDVVEAMSTRRPYREARTKEKTLSVIKEGKGDKFDPEVVDILVDMIEEGEVEFGEK